MKLIVTGPNAWHQTYDVVGLNNETAFVFADEVVVADDNDNGYIDFNEDININLEFYNAGLVGVDNVTSTLTTTSQDYVELMNTNLNIGSMNANSSKTFDNAFSFKVKDNVPNQQYIFFTINTTDGESTWSQDLAYRVQAPVLYVVDLEYNDKMGNNNGFVDAGETIEIDFRIKNIGDSRSEEIVVEGSSSNPNVVFEESSVSLNALNKDQVAISSLIIDIDENTPDGEQFVIDIYIKSSGYELHEELKFTVGTLKEDFETGNFSHLTWMFDNDLPCRIILSKITNISQKHVQTKVYYNKPYILVLR